ncbi:MAG: YicC family protein, partial [Burkholderiales bacterium]|nr:YicC family protein [Burkholderiales bacterium]
MASKLFSMTGFGSCSVDTKIGNIQIEIKSVNSRFLDVFTLTNSDTVRTFEGSVKKKITENEDVKRGKVECRITVASDKNKELSVNQLNKKALDELLELQKIVKKETKAKSLTINEILLFPGVMTPIAEIGEDFESILLNCVGEALRKFNDSRAQEGEKLAKVLLVQCNQIDKLVSDLRPRIPDIIASLQQKLTERLEEALAEQLAENSTLSKEEINERIRQEVTLYATRMDVAEEMDRLT